MKSITCPKCKSKNIVPIAYGYPSEKDMDSLLKASDEEKVVLGGCCVSRDDPEWYCKDCKNKFGHRYH